MRDTDKAVQSIDRANRWLIGIVIGFLLTIIAILTFVIIDTHAIDTQNDQQLRQYIQENKADNNEQLRLLRCLVGIQTASLSPEQITDCQSPAKTSYTQPAPRNSALVEHKTKTLPTSFWNNKHSQNNITPVQSPGLVV